MSYIYCTHTYIYMYCFGAYKRGIECAQQCLQWRLEMYLNHCPNQILEIEKVLVYFLVCT